MTAYFKIIGVLLLASGCGSNVSTEQPKLGAETKQAGSSSEVLKLTDAQFINALIKVGPIQSRQLSNVVRANGAMEVPPQNLASVSSPIGGFIRQTDMLQGRRVRKGETMAVIENADLLPLQQHYLENRARLEYLRLEFERQTELRRENVGAGKVLQLAASEYEASKAQAAALAEQLRGLGIVPEELTPATLRRTIQVRAPIGGSVSRVNVNLGKRIEPTDVLFQIVNTDHLHAELTVFEQDVAKLKVGQRVRFTLANDPSVEREATVYLVNQALDEGRSVRVHAHLLREEPGLLPGTYLSAIIEVGDHPSPSLPEAAIVDANGQPSVFQYIGSTVEGGEKTHSFRLRAVTTGVAEGGFVSVTLLPPADGKAEFVLVGAFRLLAQLIKDNE